MIHWSHVDGVTVAMLDRPERRNALDRATVDDLANRLSKESHGAGAPPVVLTAAGTTFCSGFDLTTRDEGTAFKERADELFAAIVSYPAPVIAALNGPVVGMGAVLAATCDLRIGRDGTWFEVPSARLGIVMDDTYLGWVRDRVGIAAAQLLFVGSRRVAADRALQLGLLHAIVDDPLGEALSWARHTTELSMPTTASHKAVINRRS